VRADKLMQGFPPEAAAVVTRENWTSPPYLRWGFLHTREIVSTARIGRGDGPVLELPHDPYDVEPITYTTPNGASSTVRAMLDEGFTDGFLVLQDGRIRYEHYGEGMTQGTTHLLQSVSKSITGTVAGILIGDGRLAREAAVTEVIPELAGSSFEGATVRDVLDMRTGTRFNETYSDPDSDVRISEQLAGWRPPRAGLEMRNVYEQIASLDNARPHGEVFEYRSILTDLLGWMLERASGLRLAELISQELWSKIGAEQDAEITVHEGVALPDGGICVTLRDLARFALLHMRAGELEGRRIVPEEWVMDTRFPDAKAVEAYNRSEDAFHDPGWAYRNQWWVIDPRQGITTGLGIHGQFAYVNPAAGVVCVKLSTWPDSLDPQKQAATLAACAAIAAKLAS
jgi:CubicO group peptidase (beta-lactamase class C family)